MDKKSSASISSDQVDKGGGGKEDGGEAKGSTQSQQQQQHESTSEPTLTSTAAPTVTATAAVTNTSIDEVLANANNAIARSRSLLQSLHSYCQTKSPIQKTSASTPTTDTQTVSSSMQKKKPSSTPIIQVNRNDVFDDEKNHPGDKHPGNKNYNELIKKHAYRYNLLSSEDINIKVEIINTIIQTITQELSPPGRFLRRKNVNQYVNMDRKKVIEMIISSFSALDVQIVKQPKKRPLEKSTVVGKAKQQKSTKKDEQIVARKKLHPRKAGLNAIASIWDFYGPNDIIATMPDVEKCNV